MSLGPKTTFNPQRLEAVGTKMKATSTLAVTDTKCTTKTRHPGFFDLPKELRDEIYGLVMDLKDSGNPEEYPEEHIRSSLTDDPCEDYRTLTQVSRRVREESSDVYWSCSEQCFVYTTYAVAYTPKLIQAHISSGCGLRFPSASGPKWDQAHINDLAAWFSTYGKLAASRVRHLGIWLSTCGAEVKIDLAQSRAEIWFGYLVPTWSNEQVEKVKAFALSILSPNGQTKMTFERFVTLYNTLIAVEQKESGSLKRSEMGTSDSLTRAKIAAEKDAWITELLNIEK